MNIGLLLALGAGGAYVALKDDVPAATPGADPSTARTTTKAAGAPVPTASRVATAAEMAKKRAGAETLRATGAGTGTRTTVAAGSTSHVTCADGSTRRKRADGQDPCTAAGGATRTAIVAGPRNTAVRTAEGVRDVRAASLGIESKGQPADLEAEALKRAKAEWDKLAGDAKVAACNKLKSAYPGTPEIQSLDCSKSNFGMVLNACALAAGTAVCGPICGGLAVMSTNVFGGKLEEWADDAWDKSKEYASDAWDTITFW